MMINSVTIIGVGSIGGHLCKYLSQNNSIRTIQVIDFDKVEKENIEISVYGDRDVDHLKVDALQEKFGKKIIPVNLKYKDKDMWASDLINTDITIDCRDTVVIPYSNIDLSIFVVAGKTIIFDFRKNIEIDSEYIGKYVDQMSYRDMDLIGEISSDFICGKVMEKYRNSDKIYSISLSYIENQLKKIDSNLRKEDNTIWNEDYYLPELASSELDRTNEIFEKHHEDKIYSLDCLENHVNGITPIIEPAFKENKLRDIEIRYWEKEEELTYRKVIPKGLFKEKYDIIREINHIIVFYSPVVQIATLVNRYDIVSIDIFPLTKGA